ncbi:MAG: TonB-dependent receptor, partial [Bacteroidia bacterium]|nr:TonB-dependent receptor [Bacteroidia bacterium]
SDKNRFDLSDRALTPPWQPIYDPQGPGGYAPAVLGYDSLDGSWSNEKRYSIGTRLNALGDMAFRYNTLRSLRNLGHLSLEIEPWEGFTVKATLGLDWYRHQRQDMEDYQRAVFDYTAGDLRQLGGGNSVGTYSESTVVNFNLIREVSLSYLRCVGKHQIDVLLNAMHQPYQARYTILSHYLKSTALRLRDISTADAPQQFYQEKYHWVLQGFLLRLSYHYQSRYYLDLIVRRDGSSRFSPQHRWGIFPALSVAWRISEEPFMKWASWLSDLKLRAGWGQLGNQEVRPWAFVSPVEPYPAFDFGSQPGSNGQGSVQTGVAFFSFPNPELRWEKTTTTNLALEATFNNQLSFVAEYYHKITSGILQETSIPPTVGSILDPVANVALVRNQGVELTLNYQAHIGPLKYQLSANLSTVNNQVLRTYRGIPLYLNDQDNRTYDGRIEEGYPINYIYGYQVGGLLRSSGRYSSPRRALRKQQLLSTG